MSIEKVIYNLLSTSPEVTALAGQRIYPSYLPLNTPMPAVTYQVVSRIERTTVASAEPKVHVRYRVQINSMARDYDGLVALLAAVRTATANQRGDIVGVEAVTIRPEFQGIDVYNEDGDFYTRSTDVLATLLEPVS